MNQLIQNLRTGETLLENIPVPQVRKGCVLIKTHRSLVSLGTEKMLVEFGKANLIEKARQQLSNNASSRVGLIATQAIRGGANRQVLERIKRSGDIFFAISDRNWVVDGANVHVSLIGFDNGSSDGKVLASGGLDGLVNLWESQRGEQLTSLPPQNAGVAALLFRFDRSLAVVSRYGTVAIWQVATDPEAALDQPGR